MSAEKPDFLLFYLIFILLELPAAAYVALERHALRPELRILFATSVAILLILPLFHFGPSNDLVMRGSIPVLLIVAFAFGDILCTRAARDRVPRIGPSRLPPSRSARAT